MMQNDFNARVIRDTTQLTSACQTKSPLQTLIDSTILGFYTQGAIAGNGGAEVVQEIVSFLGRPEAPSRLGFESFDEFLKYRIEDAAIPFVYPLSPRASLK